MGESPRCGTDLGVGVRGVDTIVCDDVSDESASEMTEMSDIGDGASSVVGGMSD